MNTTALSTKYFTSYSGVKLPFKLVGEISTEDMNNRNTFYEGYFNPQEQLCGLKKIVYGETELEHRYVYHENGCLKQAQIIEDGDEDEMMTMLFDDQGTVLSS